tara:strand:- start:481 stop:1440 length:960 start_codon:yes stop_codon:yes gene_type:complete
MAIKKIGIITRDCAGINATIRAVVRSAVHCGVGVLGIKRGFSGLIENDVQPLDRCSVSGIVNHGGTILKTARATEFKRKQGQIKALRTIQKNALDGLIVIGGNGSLAGAHTLADKYSVPVIGIPATIDNDINQVPMTIGADTAVNVALEALDKIRDTATSLERIFLVEVMGRACGYIALRVALAGGCEEVIVPEKQFDIKKICKEITKGYGQGKITWIIVVAEGKARAADLSKIISKITKLETREVVLGHIQRGGAPTAFDRILAARYGQFAVNALLNKKTDKCVTLKNDNLALIPLKTAIEKKDIEVSSYYKLIKLLT